MGDDMTATQQTKSYTEPTFEENSLNMRTAMALNSAIAVDDDMQVDQLMHNISMPASVLDALKVGMVRAGLKPKGLALAMRKPISIMADRTSRLAAALTAEFIIRSELKSSSVSEELTTSRQQQIVQLQAIKNSASLRDIHITEKAYIGLQQVALGISPKPPERGQGRGLEM